MNKLDALRQLNTAELVASALRSRIVSGDLADGDLLPKQEDLAEQFGTSTPSVREGLRILEGEGLVTVRRGRLGGGIVHAPAGDSAAYMLGLVLESRKVRLKEIGGTLTDIEPICAGLCAERKDRKRTVLPRLRAVQDASDKSTNLLEGIRLGRRFHEELVRGCGRETMVVLIGVLETIWTAHSEHSGRQGQLASKPPDRSYIDRRGDDHRELITLIADGDADAAIACARRHLESSTYYRTEGRESSAVIEAALIGR